MSEIPEKQIKRLRSLIGEAETNLSAAKELLISVIGDGETITFKNCTYNGTILTAENFAATAKIDGTARVAF